MPFSGQRAQVAEPPAPGEVEPLERRQPLQLPRKFTQPVRELTFSETTQGGCLGGLGQFHQIEAKAVGAFAQRAQDLVFVF
jgi:hypothetical protein